MKLRIFVWLCVFCNMEKSFHKNYKEVKNEELNYFLMKNKQNKNIGKSI